MSKESSSKRPAAAKRAKQAKLAQALRDDAALGAAISSFATLELTCESLQLEAEAEIKAIKESAAARIEKVKAEMAELFAQTEHYTRTHRDRLFKGDEKSTTIQGHKLTLRLTPPKVDTIKGTTQKDVLAALIEHEDEAFADAFVRWSESLNKEAILEQWDTETSTWKPGGERLADLGIEITQTEQFELKTARTLTSAKTTKGEAQDVAA